MDNNPLKTLPPRAFHLTGLINVQKVFLKNCSLNDLDPTALAGLVILIELDLSENNIKELKQGTFLVSNFLFLQSWGGPSKKLQRDFFGT